MIDLLNKTNVRITETKEVSNELKKTELKQDNIQIKIAEEKIEENKEKLNPNQSNNYYDYKELMKIRLNNILRIADRESLKEYIEFFDQLEGSLDNLDERKIYNLLLDCSIKAGSKDGIIITASNENILNELYDSFFDIEKLFINKISKELKVCFYLDSEWDSERAIYIKKIKNKENIEELDEKNIFEKIKDKDKSENNEFADLLEIGE